MKFLIDSDSFIRAKNHHYSMDFCPGFWDALLYGYKRKKLGSVKPIRQEIIVGKDCLADWVKDQVPAGFFLPTDDAECGAAYSNIMNWVEGKRQYTRAAKSKFANAADPWLIAAAVAHQCTIVTYEQPEPDSKIRVKIPDVAKAFKVKCVPVHAMMRQLGLKLTFVVDEDD
jgi:hypothetical protein